MKPFLHPAQIESGLEITKMYRDSGSDVVAVPIDYYEEIFNTLKEQQDVIHRIRMIAYTSKFQYLDNAMIEILKQISRHIRTMINGDVEDDALVEMAKEVEHEPERDFSEVLNEINKGNKNENT